MATALVPTTTNDEQRTTNNFVSVPVCLSVCVCTSTQTGWKVPLANIDAVGLPCDWLHRGDRDEDEWACVCWCRRSGSGINDGQGDSGTPYCRSTSTTLVGGENGTQKLRVVSNVFETQYRLLQKQELTVCLIFCGDHFGGAVLLTLVACCHNASARQVCSGVRRFIPSSCS
mgnify:CR=1 FL=1